MKRRYANHKAMIALSVLTCAVIITVPAVQHSREQAQILECRAILAKIDWQKQQWTLFYNTTSQDVPTWASLITSATVTGMSDPSRIYHYIPRITEVPQCPAGGEYTLNAIGAPPTCSPAEKGHVMPERIR